MADRAILVLTLILAGVYFWATAQIPSLEIGDPLGPKAFPRLLGIGLLITAAMLFFEILRARKTAAQTQQGAAPAGDNGHYVVIGAVVAWTFAFFLVFEFLGYMISSVIYLLGMFWYFHKKKTLSNVLTAVLYSVISYFLFTAALGVNLPRGILPV